MLKGIQQRSSQTWLDSTTASFEHRATLSRLELEIDKTLLQLLAVECREGEERGMRALELVELMRDRTGRMMEAAGKIAERYGRTILGEKIRAGRGEAGGRDGRRLRWHERRGRSAQGLWLELCFSAPKGNYFRTIVLDALMIRGKSA